MSELIATPYEAPASPGLNLVTLYVHVYPSPLFAAHWSFFLPHNEGNLDLGDRIHATGDRLNGFQYEHIRDYLPKDDSRYPNAFPVGRVSVAALQGTEPDNREGSLFDLTCRDVPVPGPGLNSAAAGGGAPKRREVRDCQWWIKQAVARLVEDGVLVPLSDGDDGPISLTEKLPKH